MKIKDLMTVDPAVCVPGTTIAEAALMLDADCGMLPVVDAGALVGVVTDRDMCIALATRDRRASEVTVGEVIHSPVWTCAPEDDVQTAFELMKEHRVRRLPVTGLGGTVMGVVSLNDLVLAAGPRKGLPGGQVMEVMQAICAHHRPAHHLSLV